MIVVAPGPFNRPKRTYLLAAIATCQLPLGENGCALQNAEIAEQRRAAQRMTEAMRKLKLWHFCQHGSADTTSAILGALRVLCVEQGRGWTD